MGVIRFTLAELFWYPTLGLGALGRPFGGKASMRHFVISGPAISSWLAEPAAGILEPGERHWDILRGLVRDGQAAGPLVMDAVLAAIALEHGATVCTTDRDLSRFSGLKWTNPLTENR